LTGKEPHEVFEQYVNTELKEMIVRETNRYAAQKNTTTTFSIADLTGYHSLPRSRMYWEKEEDIGLLMVYESMSRREFEDIKRYITFSQIITL